MARSTMLQATIAFLACSHVFGLVVRGPSPTHRLLQRRHQQQAVRVSSPRAPASGMARHTLFARPGSRSSQVGLLSAAEETADTGETADMGALAAAPAAAIATPTLLRSKGAPVGSRKGASLLASNASLAAIVIAEFAIRKAFLRAGLVFPSSLAGMVGLFAGLVVLDRAAPELAENVVRLLEPGAAVLARWLPVFFAPSLVVLPLSPAPSPVNALKLLLLVYGGWFASLVSTAAVVTALSPEATDPPAVPAAAAPSPSFHGSIVWGLGFGAVVAGVLAVAGASGQAAAAAAAAAAAPPPLPGGVLFKLSKPAAQLSMLLVTLFGFTAGTRLPRRFARAVHPVVTCTAVTMAAAATIGQGVGIGFAGVLRSYVTKSRCPVHLGAGDLLLGFLGPSVVSFAVQMYRRRALICMNGKRVAGGAIFCASSGLFGTALVSRLLGLPPALRLPTLSRNITSPLAMAICSLVGAEPSLAIAIVVITGVLGANFGAMVLDALGVKDPAARGMAQGGSAHGLGTAAMVDEPTCFAFSAVAMALTATASTVLVSIPPIRAVLLRLALGAGGGAGVPPVLP